MSDLLLFGPILFLGAFGWIASVISLRSGRRFRAVMQHDAGRARRLPGIAGPAE